MCFFVLQARSDAASEKEASHGMPSQHGMSVSSNEVPPILEVSEELELPEALMSSSSTMRINSLGGTLQARSNTPLLSFYFMMSKPFLDHLLHLGASYRSI